MALRTRNRRKPSQLGQRWPLVPELNIPSVALAGGELTIAVETFNGGEPVMVATGQWTGITVFEDAGGGVPTGANLVAGIIGGEGEVTIQLNGIASALILDIPSSDAGVRTVEGAYLPMRRISVAV